LAFAPSSLILTNYFLPVNRALCSNQEIPNNMKMRSIKSRWSTFTYNYQWSDYVRYIDGWIPKLALTVPVLGYLILFNDQVSSVIQFSAITGKEAETYGLEGVQRLRLLYFGLIFLGISNFVYTLRKPYQFKFGTNFIDYSRTCLEVFTVSDYIHMHHEIRDKGHISTRGKYYDSTWDGFLDAATNTGEGTENVERDGNWEESKRIYGGLIRDILYETFLRYDRGRRGWLTFCILVSTIGYSCLLLPSLDLFIKVVDSALGVMP
jgi:hypothetical protein